MITMWPACVGQFNLKPKKKTIPTVVLSHKNPILQYIKIHAPIHTNDPLNATLNKIVYNSIKYNKTNIFVR